MASSPKSAPDPAQALEFFRAKMTFTTGPVELSKRLKDNSVRVVDVRSKDDFAREHIRGSIHLPESEWRNASAHGLADDKPNVLLCDSQVCHLAARAAVELATQGLPVMELEGGFDAWKKHHLPTEQQAEATGGDQPIARARELLAETRVAQQQQRASPPGEAEAGEAKAGEEKAGEEKPAEVKAGEEEPAEAKASEEEPAEAKASEEKAAEKKAGEEEPAEAKAGEEKPAEKKASAEPAEERPTDATPAEADAEEAKVDGAEGDGSKGGDAKVGDAKEGDGRTAGG